MAKAFDQRDCPDGSHTPTNEKIPTAPMVDNIEVPGAGPPSGESTDGTGGTTSPPAQTELCDHVKLKNVQGSDIPDNSALEVVDWDEDTIEVKRPTQDSIPNALVTEDPIPEDTLVQVVHHQPRPVLSSIRMA